LLAARIGFAQERLMQDLAYLAGIVVLFLIIAAISKGVEKL